MAEAYAYDEDTINASRGAYVYNAALYCEPCTDENWIVTLEPDATASGAFGPLRMPQGPYPNGGGEADTPQHCDECGVFLRNPLTDDGREYVRDAIEHINDWDHDTDTVNEWREFYALAN